MKPEEAYKGLVANPEKFLKDNKVLIAGYTKGAGHVKDKYFFTMNDDKDGKPTIVSVMGGDTGPQGSYKVASAHSVPMHENKDVKFDSLPFVTLDDKAPVMFTGQLTGCSFVMLKEGDNLLCAHIRPGGAYTDGVKLQTELMNKARFKDHADKSCVVFGRREYGDDMAHVVGVRVGKVWKVFCQIRPGIRSANQNAPVRATQIL